MGGSLRATDVTWKDVTYHDAAITSANGDRVTLSGTRDSDGTAASFEMPLSSVPDEVIQAYRATHNPAGRVNMPLTPKEEAAMKAERALRKAKLENLEAALAKDPYHPVIVAGHIVVKYDDGVVIRCDANTPSELPQCAGTVFLKDCPGAQKLPIGDPVAAIGYEAGQHIYNFQNIQAFSSRPQVRRKTPQASPPSTGSTPASSP